MNKNEFDKRMSCAKKRNEELELKMMLKAEKNKYKEHNKKLSTSKLIALYLFFVLNVVLIYSLVAMWHFSDLSYLGTLITDIAGQILVYLIYAKKSMTENSKGGITYELAMLNNKNQQSEEGSKG